MNRTHLFYQQNELFLKSDLSGNLFIFERKSFQKYPLHSLEFFCQVREQYDLLYLLCTIKIYIDVSHLLFLSLVKTMIQRFYQILFLLITFSSVSKLSYEKAQLFRKKILGVLMVAHGKCLCKIYFSYFKVFHKFFVFQINKDL